MMGRLENEMLQMAVYCPGVKLPVLVYNEFYIVFVVVHSHFLPPMSCSVPPRLFPCRKTISSSI